jgi:hypothetical protein
MIQKLTCRMNLTFHDILLILKKVKLINVYDINILLVI